jgi:Reverse transcriptase (RNA-dependent DNA polymerase)
VDVKNTFLQGNLEEEIYMNLPPGHEQEKSSNIVCRLKKSIYGLKQSPRACYLISCNFKVSSADHSLFTKNNGRDVSIILVYVYDLIITGSNEQEITLIKQRLKGNFDIKDLGYLKYFLGIEVAFSKRGLFISQRKYVLDLLKEIGKLGCKPVSTPIECKLNSEDGDVLAI